MKKKTAYGIAVAIGHVRQAIKPDGVQRQVVGEVISRFEKKGYKLVAMKVSKAVEVVSVSLLRSYDVGGYSDFKKR